MTACVRPGDRITLRGGYDMYPLSSKHPEGFFGTITRFIPGQNSEPAVVVALDSSITFDGLTGSIVVLELRHENATWVSEGTVHFELCDFEPESKEWKHRRQGKWIESQGEYKVQRKETS